MNGHKLRDITTLPTDELRAHEVSAFFQGLMRASHGQGYSILLSELEHAETLFPGGSHRIAVDSQGAITGIPTISCI